MRPTTLFFVACLAACSSTETSNTTPSGLVTVYTQPGCGSAARPVQIEPSQDACLTTVCGCDGETHGDGCGYASAPFSKFGDCDDPVDGDAASDTPDAPDGTLADGDGADGAPCPSGEGIYYDTAGCGAAANPKCISHIQDACAGTFCGCDGVTYTGGCNISVKPFAKLGPCASSDAATDGG